MENLILLAESMQQASALLADEESEDVSTQDATFLNVVAVGNTGAGKSAVLNSLIGHAVLPTGENGATRAPILVDLESDKSGSKKGLAVLHSDGRAHQVSASEIRHSLQGRFSKLISNPSRGQPEDIHLMLRSSTAPPLRLIDLPGLDQRDSSEDSLVHRYARSNDAVLLLVVPAPSVREITGSQALRVIQDIDGDGSRTVGVISKVDQAVSDQRSLVAVQALLSGEGPTLTSKIPWVAMIGQSVSIAAAHAGSVGKDDSLETAWRAEMESLKSILSGASPAKLGRVALLDTIARQIRNQIKRRLPTLLSGLEGRSQIVEEELVRLGEQLVQTEEGTRAIALELCREFEDRFLLHINTGEGGSHRVIASFEGSLPKRIKQLPLGDLFELSNLKKVVLEADGYLPYLFSPEKGLRELIRRALELAKDPAKQCVDEVHRILVDIVASTASSTPGLGRYPPLKREIVAIASAALDDYRLEAKKMVTDLVDMERAFVPPQHFGRLVQRRLRREDELKTRASKKAQDTEQVLLNRATSGQANGQTGGSLKSLKGQTASSEKDTKETTSQNSGTGEDLLAGYLMKKSGKNDTWSKRWFVLTEKTNKLGYTKKQEEKRFRDIINLEECLIEDAPDKENIADNGTTKSSAAKDLPNGTDAAASAGLVFKISNKVPYKTVMKAHHAVFLRAANMAEKMEWMTRLRNCTQTGKGTSNKGPVPSQASEPVVPLRTSVSDSALDTVVLRRPIDPEEDMKMMAQEVRDYVEAVLNSLSANIPKASVFCQVERAKDSMLGTLYKSLSVLSTTRVKELLQEDQEVKRHRERCQRQASLISKLTRQLSIHEAQASIGNGSIEGTSSSGSFEYEDWRAAFEDAGRSRSSSDFHRQAESPRTSSNGRLSSRRHSDSEENGDASRRTPNRRPPPPPSSGAPVYRY
ncbi:hypothetical protein O6H91_03G105200 [Diphasiastrum complanatum]|uniref:Uncharacterized protein n=1 Tax=Diphasiastrum complanatum TaxID=34168 RepID=A0ACC2EAC5_DIPCM|nr:hypothetical protein O6H91_03G105200 [Diphasiastrum complanatum]